MRNQGFNVIKYKIDDMCVIDVLIIFNSVSYWHTFLNIYKLKKNVTIFFITKREAKKAFINEFYIIYLYIFLSDIKIN